MKIWMKIFTFSSLKENVYIVRFGFIFVEYTDCFFAEGKDPPHECPRYDTKQSDGEVLVMLGLRGIQSTPSLPLLQGPLWPGVVAPDRALSLG